MLTRIYGTAYATKDELKEHLEQMEEAKKRDHNKLGREMKIFTTVDVIGQGLPLIMPNGVIMMQELQRWIEDEETKRGYVRTKTPLMAKSDLYKISGHWDHYKDGMFVLGDEEKDKEVYALRPMTCPFQYYVYKACLLYTSGIQAMPRPMRARSINRSLLFSSTSGNRFSPCVANI